MDTTKIILACDESGAKGFADQGERVSGEVGVYAGILMPEECALEKMPLFEGVKAKYLGSDGKLHITDLPANRQAELRDDVYDAIRKSGLPCFWYAVHVAGFQAQHQVLTSAMSQSYAARQSAVKLGSFREHASSLHEELFGGLFGRLVAFCEERNLLDVDFEIRLDNVDAPIIKGFKEQIKNIIEPPTPKIKNVTGFDPLKKSIVHGAVHTSVVMPPELQLNIRVRETRVVTPLDDALVLAADVLANSLAHLFHNRAAEEKFGPLNSPTAVAAHPLGKHLDAFENWGGPDIVGDCLYAHPNAPK